MSDERVLSAIPNAVLKGGFLGFGSRSYTLVLTDRRILFAQLTSERMKAITAEARAAAKAEGKGLMGQWGAQLGAFGTLVAGYMEMPPAAILAETADNFAVDTSAIQKLKLKTAAYTGDGNADGPERLLIKTAERKYDLTLGSGLTQAKRALAEANLG